MTAPAPDIINGLTPLETRLAGVHPRLYFTAERFAWLRAQRDEAPWARHLARLRRLAAAGDLPATAVLWPVTGERAFLDAAQATIRRQLDTVKWPQNLRKDGFGPRDCLLHLALAYDWLYHDLEADLRLRLRDCLEHEGRKHYEALAKHDIYQSNILTCNTLTDVLANTAASGFAVYGDGPLVGPWLRFVHEKARLITGALAGDGASQEGICYGGFFNEYYLKTLVLVRELYGWDFLAGNEYLRHVPLFHLYSMLPRHHVTERNVLLCFGDGVRYNWHGPDYFLRLLAHEYRDGVAQWTANVQEERDATRHVGAYLNLAWDDPAIAPSSPEKLPTLHHFADKEIVVLRSGWDGDEAVLGFHCGPHAGHHALAHYRHCIGAGHMAPDAGNLLLFAHGDWLLSDGGYARKFTAYRNVALINGVGQTGEGGEWFECSQLRRERRGPAILRVQRGDGWDYVIGHCAPAYEPAAGVRRYLRHLLYLRPDTWVLVDEIETTVPARSEILFHNYGEEFQTDRPFTPAGPRAWETGGKRGTLRLTALGPDDVIGTPEHQPIQGIGAHRDRELCCLRLAHPTPRAAVLFVTVLEARVAGTAAAPAPTLAADAAAGSFVLTLATAAGPRRFALRPAQLDPALPALAPVE